jgi:hypothetical protein
MKSLLLIGAALTAGVGVVSAQGAYANFIRETQFPSGDYSYLPVEPTGDKLSEKELEAGGARFDLIAVRNAPYVEYLLDSRFVGAFVPLAQVRIESQDPYSTPPRTRADRPFKVYITLDGLRTGADDPEASKKVNLLHHIQSYGEGGTDKNINRDNATLLTPTTTLSSNIPASTEPYTTLYTSLEGSTMKVRGEERFSIYTLNDYQAPPSQIASATVQIWPRGTGKIEGIAAGDVIKFKMPDIKITYTNIYPDSTVYAQVYPGGPADGTEGVHVEGSGKRYYSTEPESPDPIILTNWDRVFTKDGEWTIELISETPFGREIIAQIGPFTLDRTIQVNGGLTTSE